MGIIPMDYSTGYLSTLPPVRGKPGGAGRRTGDYLAAVGAEGAGGAGR